MRKENVTTPLASPDLSIIWLGIDLLQEIKLAILVFQITKDTFSFLAGSY